MQNKPDYPRMCYVLGEEENPVRPGEIFTFDSLEGEFVVSNEGLVCRVINGFPTTPLPGLIVCDFINHPEKIQRLPDVNKADFTAAELSYMELHIEGGLFWVARDKGGALYAFHSKPIQHGDVFSCDDEHEEFCGMFRKILPKITHEISPIDMRLICGE